MIRKKRGIGAGKINGPGGKIDPGETPMECAVRETKEEVGLTVLDAEKRAEVSFSFACGTTPEIHGHVFMGTRFEGELCETDEALPMWFPLGDVPYGEMWDDDRYWLPAMLAGQRVRARFVFEGEKVRAMDVKILNIDEDWE